MKSTLDLSGIKKHKSKMKSLESKEVEWGFLEGQHSKADMSYAALAALLEYGTKTPEGKWHIPPRPAFRDLIAQMRTAQAAFVFEMEKHVQGYFEKDNPSAELLLTKTGQYLKSRHQDTMRNWLSSGSQYQDNAEETIDLKGFNMPFVYTGELVDNVKFKVK